MRVWISFILLVLGTLSNDSRGCSTPNLYDEFVKHGSHLKKVENKYFKCLAMYNRDPFLNLTEETIAKIVGLDFPVDLIAKQSMSKLTEARGLDHSYLYDAFKKTCIYESHMKELGDQLSVLLKSQQYELKLTCPLGLLWDIICTFTSCLQADKCIIDGETCQENDTASCQGLVELEFYCKRDFQNFLESCIDTVENELTVDAFHDSDTGCSDFNYIYQGLSSLQVVEEGVISAHCNRGDNVTATLSCFEQGKRLHEVTWTINDDTVPSGSGANFTINLEGDDTIRCHKNSREVANVRREHVHHLCNSNKEGMNTDSVRAPSSTNQNNAAAEPTEPPATTSSPTPDIERDKWKNFFKNGSIWLLKFDEDDDSLEGMDTAFNNGEWLLRNVDKLSVAEVSVMGRFTPICGEFWNKRAADVFCRDAGTQVQQNWTSSYVGSLHKGKNVKHEFYQHYLRNISCTGNESKIIWCDHDGWYHHSGCSHHALVICSKVEKDLKGGETRPYLLPIVIIGVIIFMCIVFSTLLCYFGKYESIGKKLRKVCYQAINGKRISESDNKIDPPYIPGTSPGTSVTFAQPGSDSATVVSSRSINGNSFSMSDLDSFGMGDSVSRQVADSDDEEPVFPPIIENGDFHRLNSSEAQVKVYLWERENGTCVCKSCELDSRETLDNMWTEQFFLSHINHPNIVKCVEEPSIIRIGSNTEDHTLYFFMEYLELGGLDKHLRSRDQETKVNYGHSMTVEDATNVIVGMCRALHYVHKLGYVHGDISTDNFLAFRNKNTGLLDVKLGDFETFYKPYGGEWIPKKCTHLYSAPEITLDDPKDSSGKNITKNAFKNDVWGLALVIWEVQSWIMCKNNRAARTKGEQQGYNEPTNSSFLDRASRFIRSRIIANPQDNYTCRRKMHVALLEKIDVVNPDTVGNRPSHDLMRKFYKRCHHPNIGLPSMHPGLDRKFGWPLKGLLTKCLEVNPVQRYTMEQVLQYILKYTRSEEHSPLSKYRTDVETDLDVRNLQINLEDAEPVHPDPVFSPATLQTNMGQLYRAV